VDPLAEYLYWDQLRNNRYSQLSVSLDIPLFNRMVTRTEIYKARIRVDDSKYAQEQSIQQLYKSIRQVHGNAVASLQKYYSAMEERTSAEEAYHYVQQKYDAGLANAVDFSIARNNLLRSGSELIRAKYEYIFSMKILDFYMGKEVRLE